MSTALSASTVTLAAQLNRRLLQTVDRLPSSEAVHEVRKIIKQQRSLLWFLRTRKHAKPILKHKKRLQVLARQLAPAREHDALVELVRNRARRSKGAEKRCYKQVLPYLFVSERRGEPAQASRQINAQSYRNLVSKTPLSAFECATELSVAMAYERVFKRGKRLLLSVKRCPDAEALHRLRKQVKHRLHFHKLLLSSDQPDHTRLVKRLSRLAGLLGEHHDSAELLDWLKAADHLPKALRKSLKRYLRCHQAALEKRCLALGAKLY